MKMPWGVRRVASYRASNGWFMDVDVQEAPSAALRPHYKRYFVFYGPSTVLAHATRREAFAWVRRYLETGTIEAFVPAPYVRGVRT